MSMHPIDRSGGRMIEQLDKGYLFTDIGALEVAGTEHGIVSVTFVESVDTEAACVTSVVQQCIAELSQYFGGKRTRFSVLLNPGGTEFRGLVWHCLLYTSDAADDLLCVDLGGRRIIKKK